MKWQGYCDGYGGPGSPSFKEESPPSQSSSTSGQMEISRGRGNQLVRRRAIETLLQPASTPSLFQHESEKTYFEYWLGLADNVGGGWFQTNLFSRTIPQLSEAEPAVRYAAIAVGALASAMTPNIIPSTCLTGPPLDFGHGRHYKNALTYYGRALRLVRLQQGANYDSTVRSAVIACMLFVCFETLHGNRDAAFQHINYGLTILEQFLRAKQKAITGTDETPPQSPEADPTIKLATSRLLEYQHKSPQPLIIEDEVLQVFQRFEYQSWSPSMISRDRKAPVPLLRVPGNRTADDIPAEFGDLEEARRWWDLVQHWALHFGRTVVEGYEDYVASVAKDDPESAKTLDIVDAPITQELRPKHIAILEKWHTSFLPLYVRVRGEKDQDERSYFKAVSLLLQFQISWICIRTVCLSEYSTLYSLTPKFREVVRLSAILLPIQARVNNAVEPFTMDNGPTMALLITATKCRDATVRQQAIDLMKAFPRRDGFWDSRVATMVAEVNKDLEVRNDEGPLREQWRRLRERSAVFNGKTPEVYLTYYVKDEETKEWKLTNETLKA